MRHLAIAPTAQYTSQSGNINDGCVDGQYANNCTSLFLIQPANASSITLTFSEFNLESGFDYLYVYDGNSTSAPLVATLTGSSLPSSITSSQGSLMLKFTTDGSVVADGFSARYTSTSTPECLCQAHRNVISTSGSGTINDGSGASGQYLNNTDCQWHISAPGADHFVLTFTELNTESGFDQISLYAGADINSPLVATLSGNTIPNPIYIQGDKVTIQWTTDGSVVYGGWTLSYETSISPLGCSWSDCTSGDCGSTQYLTSEQKVTAAQYLCEHNIIDDGDGTGQLNVDANITRGQLAKIAFYGLYDGYPNVPELLVSDYVPSPYTDLQNKDAYYYRAAKCLLYLQYKSDEKGVTPFDRNRASFNASEALSRRVVLKLLMETFNIAPYSGSSTTSPFADFNSDENLWAYAKKAYDLGITNATLFRPTDMCTRGEAFVFLYRILTNANITIPTPVNTADVATSDFFIPNNLSPQALAAMGGIEHGNYKYYEKTCFSIPGWVDMDFAFDYNSYISEMPEDYYPLTPMGNKTWRHTYLCYMNVIQDPYTGHDFFLFHMGDNLLIYEKNGSTIDKVTEGNYNDLTSQGNTYTLTTPNQTVYTFEKLVSSTPIYYMTSIRNRFGDGIDVNYQTSTNSNYRRVASVTSGTDSGERTLTFSYQSGTNNLSHVSDPLGRTVRFTYRDGNLYQFTDAMGQVTTYNYCPLETESDLLRSIILPKGNSVYNEYSQRKLTSTRTNSNAATTITQSVSHSGDQTTYSSTVIEPVKSGQNIVTHHIMNSLGKVTRVFDNCNVDMTYNYTNSTHKTLPSSIVNNKTGVATTYTYTAKGLLSQRTLSSSSLSVTERWNYNNTNQLVEYTDANNHSMTYSYSADGALIRKTDALGNVTTFTNNSHGCPTSVQTPAGITQNYTYTPRGMVSQMSVSGTNLSVSYTYDVAGRKIEERDYKGNSTRYSYNNNDNLVEITDALNNRVSMAYDANENLTQITNALGGVTTLSYNDDDLCTSQSFGGHTKSFTYNTDGSIRTFVDANGQTRTFTYNNSEEITSDGYATYNYLSNGLLGSVSKDNKAIQYGYDPLGRITSVTFDGQTVGYSYDNVGNVLSITYPGNRQVRYTYDAANRMTSVTDWNSHTSTYNYRSDNLLNYVEYANNVRTTYSYDNAGRCTGQVTKRDSGNGTVIAEYSYTLDDNGNHEVERSVSPYTTFPAMSIQNINYQYSADNRLLSAGSTTFSYDENGNTTSKGGRTMSYDICNNLTNVNGDFNAQFSYDGFGYRRLAKRNGVTTKYVLDILRGDANVLMETDDNGIAQNYYVYGADGLISRIGADGSTTSYYVFDYRGSTVAMVDATPAAAVTHKYQYDEYGQILQMEEADNNPFRFVGKQGLMYESNDLIFCRARYLDATMGRFLSEDAIWSTNRYLYVNNRPTMDIDPSGCISLLEIGKIALKSIAAAGRGGGAKTAMNELSKAVKNELYRAMNNSAGKEAVERQVEPIKKALCKVLPNSKTCKNDPPKEVIRQQLNQEWASYSAEKTAKVERLKNQLNDLASEFAWQNLDLPSKIVVVGAGVGIGIGVVTVGAALIAPVLQTATAIAIYAY